MNFEVRVDALDIVQDLEDLRRSLVDIELAKTGVLPGIIIGVCCQNVRVMSRGGQARVCSHEAEKSDAPKGTRT